MVSRQHRARSLLPRTKEMACRCPEFAKLLPLRVDERAMRLLLYDQMGGIWEITSRVNVPEALSTELKRSV